MKTGIYFNMPYDVYRAEKGLSYSGVKTLLKSPAEYWNEVVKGNSKDSEFMAFGRAFHELVLLGEDEFRKKFIAPPDKENYTDLLDTVEEMKDFLKSVGHKISGSKQQLIERIRAFDLEIPIWQEIFDNFQNEVSLRDQTVLAKETIEKLFFLNNMVKADKEAAQYLNDGYPEVSLFWIKNGIQCKARLDYLQLNGISDLKKADPYRGSLASKAVSLICDLRYDLQAYIYNTGLDEVLKSDFETDANKEQSAFLDNLKKQKHFNRPFTFIMVQCDTDIPCIVTATLKEMDDLAQSGAYPHAYWNKCSHDFEYALSVYKNYLLQYGYDKPWRNPTLHINVTDADMPLWHVAKKEDYYAV